MKLDVADFEWLLRALRRGWSIAYIPLNLTVWSHRPDNITARLTSRHHDLLEHSWVTRQYVRELCFIDIMRIYSKFLKAAVVRIGSSAVRWQPERFLRACLVLPKLLLEFGQPLFSKFRTTE